MIKCYFLLDKMEELGLEEGFYFQNIREKIRQYQKSLEEIEKLDTKGKTNSYNVSQGGSTTYVTRSLGIHFKLLGPIF